MIEGEDERKLRRFAEELVGAGKETYWEVERIVGRDPPACGRQAITPLNGAFGERNLHFYYIDE